MSLGQKFVKFFCWYFGKFQTSKGHSRINWPLASYRKKTKKKSVQLVGGSGKFTTKFFVLVLCAFKKRGKHCWCTNKDCFIVAGNSKLCLGNGNVCIWRDKSPHSINSVSIGLYSLYLQYIFNISYISFYAKSEILKIS